MASSSGLNGRCLGVSEASVTPGEIGELWIICVWFPPLNLNFYSIDCLPLICMPM